MNNEQLIDKMKVIKSKIEQLIEEGRLDEARSALDQYDSKIPGDLDICSMRAVISIMEGSLEEAEATIMEGLKEDSVQFDLLFNLAYIRELEGKAQDAVDLYCKAGTVAYEEGQKQNISQAIDRIKAVDGGVEIKEKARIVFFAKAGMNNFLNDIIIGISDNYWVREIIVSDFKQIDEGMEWADICWFEWCDELVEYGSKLPLTLQKKIICRLHRYEVFTGYPNKVIWANVDTLIIVTEHLRELLETNFPGITDKVKIIVIENGVDVNRYQFKKRTNGFNLAMVGYIHSRKNPALLLQIIEKLVRLDKRYKLYVAGEFQEQVIKLYWDYQVKRMGLEKNVIFDGWQKDITTWLEDKNYLLSTSIHESFGYGIAEAMSRGIKPLIHDFLYANDIWDEEFLFNTVDDAVEAISRGQYESEKYREFIEKRYSLEKQIKKIREMLTGLWHCIAPMNDKEEKDVSAVQNLKALQINEEEKENDFFRIFDQYVMKYDKLEEAYCNFAEVCYKLDHFTEAALFYANAFKTGYVDISNHIEGNLEFGKAINFFTSDECSTIVFLSSKRNVPENYFKTILKLSTELTENVFYINPVISERKCDTENTDEKEKLLDQCLSTSQQINNATIYSPLCIVDNGSVLYEGITDVISYLIHMYSDTTDIKLIHEENLLDIIDIKLIRKFKMIHQADDGGLLSLSYYYDAGKEFKRLYNVNILEALSTNNKLFSVVIPTRNSAEYLKYTLLSCMDQDFDDYEILISDNSSPGNEDTLKLVKSLDSEKIRYIKPPQELSLVKSFEYAYLKSEGEYLFSLGSDDALLLHALKLLSKIISKYPDEDVIHWGKTFYRWPMYPENPDMFYIPYLPSAGEPPVSYFNSDTLVREIMNYDADMFALPMIYLNSAMHRRRMKKIVDTTGRFLDGGSQDVYTGLINLALSDSILYTLTPFVIAALSPNSMGFVSHYKDIYIKGNDAIKDNRRLHIQHMDTYISKYCTNLNPNNDRLRVQEFLKISSKKLNNWDYSMVNWKKFYEGYANSLSVTDIDFKNKLGEILKSIKKHNNRELEKWFLDNFINTANFNGKTYNTQGSKNYATGLLSSNGQLVLDMSNFGIDNVYDVAKFFDNLFNLD